MVFKSLFYASFVSSVFCAITRQTFNKSNILPGGFIVEWNGASLVDVRVSCFNNRHLTHNPLAERQLL